MSNISLRSNGAELILPATHSLEISKGLLTLTLTFNSEGGFTLTQNGKPVAAASPTTPDPQPGTIMPDGTVYAGISPDTGKAFYAAAHDEPELLTWQAALDRAARKEAHGHTDWRIPTFGEQRVLFNACAVNGSFNTSGSFYAAWCWSSTKFHDNTMRACRPSKGDWHAFTKQVKLSVRCVRG